MSPMSSPASRSTAISRVSEAAMRDAVHEAFGGAIAVTHVPGHEFAGVICAAGADVRRPPRHHAADGGLRHLPFRKPSPLRRPVSARLSPVGLSCGACFDRPGRLQSQSMCTRPFRSRWPRDPGAGFPHRFQLSPCGRISSRGTELGRSPWSRRQRSCRRS